MKCCFLGSHTGKIVGLNRSWNEVSTGANAVPRSAYVANDDNALATIFNSETGDTYQLHLNQGSTLHDINGMIHYDEDDVLYHNMPSSSLSSETPTLDSAEGLPPYSEEAPPPYEFDFPPHYTDQPRNSRGYMRATDLEDEDFPDEEDVEDVYDDIVVQPRTDTPSEYTPSESSTEYESVEDPSDNESEYDPDDNDSDDSVSETNDSNTDDDIPASNTPQPDVASGETSSILSEVEEVAEDAIDEI